MSSSYTPGQRGLSMYDYESQRLSAPRTWPFKRYYALNIGKSHEKFFGVLVKKGLVQEIPKPDPDGFYPYSITVKAYRTLIEETKGLLIRRATVVKATGPEPAEGEKKPPLDDPRFTGDQFDAIILGSPEQTATEEQKRLAADLLDLSVEDVVQVYIIN
ncbi:hypothetical protein NLJ89_g8146 [Agrocybe chaxingu]|uniref:Uncharacterized protein n=1 Tax=Agrocybe chaxingu TaxID=84603 RepID=A0A9W8JVX5_9AGAR|nr:hypothetical protein NLJ89_g8146 [Agrocybe chaxingu]